MLELINFPVYAESMAEYDCQLLNSSRSLQVDGIKAIWGGDDAIETLPREAVQGYHLLFYPDWVDFWRGDTHALIRKFGDLETCRSFYGYLSREGMLAQYRADLKRAAELGPRYVVFHVSDVSIEEGNTYRWEHTNRQVLDAGIELLNTLFEEEVFTFALLLENQWWPGFTFTNPEDTAYLLERVHYENKGLLLDTGHLMNTNTALRTQSDGVAYLHRMLDQHGSLCEFIKGMHLHLSLSGEYVEKTIGHLPENGLKDYVSRFGRSYQHILKIDRHEPWTEPSIASVVERIAPAFLIHELSAKNRAERETAVRIQKETLAKEGLYHDQSI